MNTDLRKAAEMALKALENSRVFVTSREKTKHPEGTEWYDDCIEALRQALAQTEKPPVKTYCGGKPNYCTPEQEPVAYVPGFYCGEKISLSRVKLGERFILIRTGEIYSKIKHGYWNEYEKRPARLHLNCQVQLIKDKNT